VFRLLLPDYRGLRRDPELRLADPAKSFRNDAGSRRLAAIDAAVCQIAAAPGGADVRLLWYHSLDDWATLPGREPVLWRPQQSVIATLAGEFPGRVALVRFSGPAYAAWLAGRPDNETARSQWAAQESS